MNAIEPNTPGRYTQSWVHADVKLSSGRTIIHRRMSNGAQEAIPLTGPAAMTDREWDEYCEKFKTLPATP